MELESSSPYPQVPAICPYPEPTHLAICPYFFYVCVILILDTLPPPPQKSKWGSSLLPDCFVSRGSISTWVVLNICFLRSGVISTSPNPQAGGPPLDGCPRLLIQFIHSYPPHRRPFLHPQPEDAPCRGDREPHSWVYMYYICIIVKGASVPQKTLNPYKMRCVTLHKTSNVYHIHMFLSCQVTYV
jgi:hypothetical protein